MSPLDNVASPPPSTGVLWTLADAWVIAKRNLVHIRHMPEKLADVTVQPVMFVLLFAYVFGSAIVVPGGHYREFLMPGIFAQQVIFASVGIMGAIVGDMQKGVMDRFRSLPMARASVLIGHTVSAFLESVLGLVVMVGCGLVVGWRAHTDVVSVAEGFALLLLIGFSLSWVGVLVGLFLRTVDAVQAVGFVVLFPLTFLANTFVPTQGFPAWLRAFADWNPTSAFVAAVRQLFGNALPVPTSTLAWPLQHAVAVSFGWCAIFVAIFLPLAVWRFRRAMSA